MVESAKYSQGQRIAKNTFAIITGDFVYQLFSFAVGVLIARSLGGRRYGEWSFIFVFLSFFDMFIKFGFDSVLTREVARHRENAGAMIGNAILLRLAFVLVSIPLVITLAGLLGYPLSTRHGLMLASFQLFLGIRSLYEVIFRADLGMVNVSVWNAVKGFVNLGLVGVIFFFRPSMYLYIAAALISGLSAAVGLALSASRSVRIQFQPDFKFMRHLLKESAPLVLSGYLTLLYYRIDVFMLSKMQGFESVGHYSVATRISEALTVIATSLLASLFPILAKAYKNSRPEFDRLVGKVTEILVGAGLPLALGGMWTATDLVELLFGEQFQGAGHTLMILLWFTCVGFISILLVNLLILCGRQIMDTWISLGLVTANIAMNAVLIPRFGYNGSAFATVMVEVAGSSAMMIYLNQLGIFPLNKILPRLKRVVAANAVLTALLILTQPLGVPVLTRVVLGAGAYLAALLTLRVFSPADIKYYFAHGFKKG